MNQNQRQKAEYKSGWESRGESYRKRATSLSLRDYVRIVLSRKWIVTSIFLLTLFATFYYLKTTEPVYQTQVVMMEEEPKSFTSFIEDMPTLKSSRQSVGYHIELLLSSSSVFEIKRKLKEEYGEEFDERQIEENLSVSSEQGSSVIKVKAKASTPKRAKILANTAAEFHIQKITDMKRTDLDQGIGFLKKQMEVVNKRLEEAEGELNEFLEKEGVPYLAFFSSDSGGELLSELQGLQTDLSKTETELELTKAQLSSYQNLISQKRKLLDQKTGSSALGSEIDQIRSKLIEQRLELGTMQESFTEKSYKVRSLKQKIDALEKSLKQELEKVASVGGDSLDPVSELQNLIYQSVSLNVTLSGLKQKEALLKEKIASFKEEHPELPAKQMELTRLRRQARVQEETYMMFREKYENMRLLNEMKTSGLEIIDKAEEPEFPVSPNKKRTLVMGVVIGLSLGVMFAFFLEYLDDSIKLKEDIERYLNLPIMGTIPKIEPFELPEEVLSRRDNPQKLESNPNSSSNELSSDDNEKSNGSSEEGEKRRGKRRKGHRKRIKRLLSHTLLYADKRNPAITNYRTLAANIRYAEVDTPIKTLLVTSAAPGEGKTVTATNLAISLAQTGKKVLLLDADLRKSRIHRIFQFDREPGLTDFLIDEASEPNLSVLPTEIDNLSVLVSGSHVSNPEMLLSSEKMASLIESLKEEYDIVIFDSPPLLSAADAITLAKETDDTLMVIKSGQTKRQIALQGKELLENVGAELLGAVLNNVDYSKQYGSYYYYYYYYRSYYYSSDDEEEG